MKPEVDERRGAPSASKRKQYCLCAGSYWLEKVAPEQGYGVGNPNEDAEFGNRVHFALAQEIEPDSLSAEEREMYDKCKDQLDAVLAEHMPSYEEVYYERRKWFYREGLCMSGKADAVFVNYNELLIVDYKTGRIPVDPAPKNLQLDALAAMWSSEYGLEVIKTCLIQPHCGEPSIAEYCEGNFTTARALLIRDLLKIQTGAGKYNPGEEQCRYCKAKSICPALKQAETGLTKFKDLSLLSPDQLSEVLKICDPLERRIEEVRALAKHRLTQNSNAVPGWALSKPGQRRSISRLDELYRRLTTELQLPPQKFAAACKITNSAVKEFVREQTGLKGKELDARLERLIEGCIETKETEPRLVKNETR